jgi:hypothetical protein
MLRSSLLLALLFGFAPAQQLLSLEIRVFLGAGDVTAETRVIVHRAGERGQPVAHVARGEARRTMKLPAGIYDCQAVQEKDGRVLNIRWAERLVVMPYPDEAGDHLEVINFTRGYGALQVRPSSANSVPFELALFAAGQRERPVPSASATGYTLFAVPAGQYDIQIRRSSGTTWHNGIEVPLDRTRLWIVP